MNLPPLSFTGLLAGLLAAASLHAPAHAQKPPPAAASAAAPAPPHNAATATLARCLRQAPPYPSAALRAELEGEATVRFAVDASGAVHSERIVRSSRQALLDQAALDHLAQCKARAEQPGAEPLTPGQYEFPMVWRLE